MYYTVEELIEALKNCPKEYVVDIVHPQLGITYFDCIGIDNETETVDLFIDAE